MACSLESDPSRLFCALGSVGAQPTVRLVCENAPTLKLVSAEFRHQPVTIATDQSIALPALVAGVSTLTAIVEGVAPADIITLTEVCDATTSKPLCEVSVGQEPSGGADPLLRFFFRAN